MPMRATAGSAMADAIEGQKQRGKRKRRFRSKLGVSVAGSDLRRLDHVQSKKVLEAFDCKVGARLLQQRERERERERERQRDRERTEREQRERREEKRK